MKWIFSVIFVFSLSVGYLINYYTQKIERLTTSISALKATNIKLKNNNKILKQKNKKFVATRKKIKTKLKQRKVRLAKLARNKLAKAPLKMVPIAGMGIIVASTASDIYDYCQEIKYIDEFENTMFGTNTTTDEKICGIDVKKQLTSVERNVQNNYNSYIKVLSKEYGNTAKYWDNQMDSFVKKLNEENKEISDYLSNYFQGKQ